MYHERVPRPAASRRWWAVAVSVALLTSLVVLGVLTARPEPADPEPAPNPPAAVIAPARASAKAVRVPAATPSGAFPLRVAPGRRYLVDAAGRPFLMTGDSAWSLISQLRREDAERYLTDRKARGFNTVLVSLIDAKFADNAPANIYGVRPFLSPGDFATPNEAYFQHADWVLQRASDLGLLVLLVPSYAGYVGTDHGFYEEMVASGATKMRGYGRFVGRRYQRFSNIMWVQGGDMNPPRRDLYDALAAGIAETDPGVLQTAHTAPDTAPLEYWPGRTWLAVNNVYTYGDVYGWSIGEYQRTTRPFFLMESAYENEHGATTQRLRRQAYHALLAGATGQLFGNSPIWHFGGPGLFNPNTTWQAALGAAGSRSMTVLNRVWRSFNWWTLQPDRAGTLLRAGAGSGEDRAVAALSTDRRLGVVYLPSRRQITLDLGQFTGGNVNLTWVDPSNGAAASAGSAAPGGQRGLTPPGNNAEGSGDWLLVARVG